MTQDRLIAITGATGYIGSHVATLLASHGIPQRLVVRDQRRARYLPGADVAVVSSYADTTGMRDALAGVTTLFLVSAREAADRVEQHKVAIDAAADAGVERIVYLSYFHAASDAIFTFARQHYHTEQHIRSTGLRYTFLRDAPYLDYVPMLVGADGVIRGPAGEGRFASVARDDVVRVVGAVLTESNHDGKTYDVAGEEELTMAQCAAILSDVTGRTITFYNETVAEAWESRAQYGASQFEVEGWVTTYLGIAAGEMGPASDIVFELTGKRAETLREFLRRSPERYEHLVHVKNHSTP